jgi:hypothetical protein
MLSDKKRSTKATKRESEEPVGWTADQEAEERLATLEAGDEIDSSIRPQVVKLYARFIKAMPNEHSHGDSKIVHQSITNNYLKLRQDVLKLLDEETTDRIFGTESDIMQFYVSVQKDLSHMT